MLNFTANAKVVLVAKMRLNNTIIYLIGYPGTGKYSIAKEIARLHPEFRLVDSHLINNPIFTLVQADGVNPLDKRVWPQISKIWDVVIDSIINLSPNHFSFILTNYLNTSESDVSWFYEVKNMAATRKATFCPVLLKINVEEHQKRIVNPQRRERLKEINPDAPIKYASQNDLFNPDDDNLLVLDVSDLSIKDSTNMILNHIKELQK
jgi:hypothetical protein